MRKLSKSIPCALKIGDLAVQRLDAAGRKLTGPGPILPRVQFKQFLYLFKRESRRLGFSNKPQASEILGSIMTIAALTRWLLKQSFALVEADGFDAHMTCCCELADC
jgi:hypothetical protein